MATLETILDECRWTYNKLLEERKQAYEQDGTSLNLYAQINRLPGLKVERESLKAAQAQVLQNVALRLDLAFQAFFRRVKAGQQPGFPRFKGKFRYDSFTYPQAKGAFSFDAHHLRISKVGKIKIKLHRPLDGTPKTCTIKRSATGKWYAIVSCQVLSPQLLPTSALQVSIDVGLESFAHFSNDEWIENPRFLRRDEKELAKVQRKFCQAAQGTLERRHRQKAVARVHERIKWRRKDFAHQESRKIVNRFGFIAVEDLDVNRMLDNHFLAKSISDAAWSLFFNLLLTKAAEAGRVAVKVHPAYTSQDCSRCGHRQKMPLSQRWFVCLGCHLRMSRDCNAALNILSLGLQRAWGNPQEAAVL